MPVLTRRASQSLAEGDNGVGGGQPSGAPAGGQPSERDRNTRSRRGGSR